MCSSTCEAGQPRYKRPASQRAVGDADVTDLQGNNHFAPQVAPASCILQAGATWLCMIVLAAFTNLRYLQGTGYLTARQMLTARTVRAPAHAIVRSCD